MYLPSEESMLPILQAGYEVTDETIMETADKHIVKDGDDIEWSFESWNDIDD